MLIVLASGSRPRQEIMERLVATSFPVDELGFVPIDIDERAVGDWERMDVAQLTLTIARAKTRASELEGMAPAILVTADTLVAMPDYEKRGKPAGARQMMSWLRSYQEAGLYIQVVTSVYVINMRTGACCEATDYVRLWFEDLTDAVVVKLSHEQALYKCAGGIMIEHPLWKDHIQMKGALDGTKGVPSQATIDSGMGLPSHLVVQMISTVR